MAPRPGLDKAGVIRAAATLVDAEGMERLSLAALADRLGVRTPTLYHYVDGLPGLRRELALLGTRELGERLGRALMGRAGDEAVVAVADAYRAFVKEHPGLYTATLRAAPEDEELRAAQTEITEMTVRAVAAYRLDPNEAIHLIRALRSLVHGFATLEVAGGFGIPLDVDESFRRLLEVFLRGIRGKL